MNAPHSPASASRPTVLAAVPMAPADPILGVTEAFVADQNPKKVNLGVGVYTDDNGKIPVLECVRRAEEARIKTSPPRGYLPIDGLQAYDRAVQELVFGSAKANVVTVQALGGTGGLKIGADFLRQIAPQAEAWISDPSWENHRQLFEAAGFAVKNYAYFEPKTRGLDFAGMKRSLDALPAGAVVVLHACCHNPTGVDLTNEQWREVLGIVQSRGLIPFLDLAYQGFAEGLEADAYAARLFSEAMSPVFLSTSFSKSFSLYGERCGALSIVTGSEEEAKRVLSNVKRIVRTNYSNPPTHGSQVIASILSDPDSRKLWDQELGGMRDRIKAMRKAIVDGIHKRVPGADWSFILRQRGMFSYTGLTKDQVLRLRKEYSIYAIESGRVCVAALNTKNVDYVADAIASVIR
ncbi:MAG TPA: amino acid aminotransferase [Burkholderiales bacterium]|nr:amino acid aminotransferase [Burkholderiales bacterium]